ncbi:UNVERIFIED_CONTAM: hypothetical protein GTU68_046745, partial [Idotea baltica]|nr:hypothetical protein [Idotea baltica]
GQRGRTQSARQSSEVEPGCGYDPRQEGRKGFGRTLFLGLRIGWKRKSRAGISHCNAEKQPRSGC